MEIKPQGERGLDDLEIGRDIEIPRHVETMVADMVHALNAIGTIRPGHRQGFDLGQDGIAHFGKTLGDQRRTDGAGWIPAAQRQQAAPPPYRNRRGWQQIAREIKDVFQIILMPQPAQA